MITFEEYKEYLNLQLRHLIISSDADLISFTKLMVSYGKLGWKFYSKEIKELARIHNIKGFDHEITKGIKSFALKNNKVIVEAKDGSKLEIDWTSASEDLKSLDIPSLDKMVLLSVLLSNENQLKYQFIKNLYK